MDRRRFMGYSLVAGAIGACGCTPASQPEQKQSAAAPSAPAAFELDEATVATLQDGMKSGKYTARSIAEQYLARIDALDKQGPRLRSVIEINPDALEIAD